MGEELKLVPFLPVPRTVVPRTVPTVHTLHAVFTICATPTAILMLSHAHETSGLGAGLTEGHQECEGHENQDSQDGTPCPYDLVADVEVPVFIP